MSSTTRACQVTGIIIISLVAIRLLFHQQFNAIFMHDTAHETVREPEIKVALKRPAAAKYTHADLLKFEHGFTPMDHPDLIKFIKQHWVVFPSSELPGALPDPEKHHSQHGQSNLVDRLLKGKRNGYFVESGASDGIYRSNSLFFEKHRGWGGLLIEPQIQYFNDIVPNRPVAHVINACLSPTTKTATVQFEMNGHKGKIANQFSDKKVPQLPVQCFPLYSILLAVGVTTIDYLSLDIEGAEVQVLKTIPWYKVKINVLTVEYRVSRSSPNEPSPAARLRAIREFFKTLPDYKEVGILNNKDVVFARRDIL